MKVFVQSVNFNVDKELVKFVETKIARLEKYFDKIIDSEVYLKVQQTSDKENKLVEVKINVPGDEFIVKKTCKTFEEGVSSASESLRRVLVKKKQKQREYQ